MGIPDTVSVIRQLDIRRFRRGIRFAAKRGRHHCACQPQRQFGLADRLHARRHDGPDAIDDLVNDTHDVQVTLLLQQSLVVMQGDGRVQIRQRDE